MEKCGKSRRVKEIISYIGGKSRIGKWIREYIPNDIETYVEPFGGMFWVFFNMDLSKYPNLKNVVYNDYNRLNANLFNCTREYDKLWDVLNQEPCQQRNVDKTPPELRTKFGIYQKEVFSPDLIITEENKFDVAKKYVYVLTQIFSGSKPESANFMDYKGKYKCKLLTFMDKLKKPVYRHHYDRINIVENMDFGELIEKYDSPSTYFYLDPPYWKTENYYSNHDFDVNDHKRLADILQNIQGKFSLSYYYFDLLNDWFPCKKYIWETKGFTKAAAAKKGVEQKKSEELLIMNY